MGIIRKHVFFVFLIGFGEFIENSLRFLVRLNIENHQKFTQPGEKYCIYCIYCRSCCTAKKTGVAWLSTLFLGHYSPVFEALFKELAVQSAN